MTLEEARRLGPTTRTEFLARLGGGPHAVLKLAGALSRGEVYVDERGRIVPVPPPSPADQQLTLWGDMA